MIHNKKLSRKLDQIEKKVWKFQISKNQKATY